MFDLMTLAVDNCKSGTNIIDGNLQFKRNSSSPLLSQLSLPTHSPPPRVLSRRIYLHRPLDHHRPPSYISATRYRFASHRGRRSDTGFVDHHVEQLIAQKRRFAGHRLHSGNRQHRTNSSS